MSQGRLTSVEGGTWRDRAACRGDDDRGRPLRRLFFESSEERRESGESRIGRELRAKRICARCPVRDQCREAGMGEIFGIWGGMTPAERGVHGRQYPRRAV